MTQDDAEDVQLETQRVAREAEWQRTYDFGRIAYTRGCILRFEMGRSIQADMTVLVNSLEIPINSFPEDPFYPMALACYYLLRPVSSNDYDKQAREYENWLDYDSHGIVNNHNFGMMVANEPAAARRVLFVGAGGIPSLVAFLGALVRTIPCEPDGYNTSSEGKRFHKAVIQACLAVHFVTACPRNAAAFREAGGVAHLYAASKIVVCPRGVTADTFPSYLSMTYLDREEVYNELRQRFGTKGLFGWSWRL